MAGIFHRAMQVLREEGVGYLFREAFPFLHRRYLRRHLPRRTVEYNGVAVRAGRLFDGLVPWRTGHPDPDEYEGAIVDALEERVETGDSVVIVGGGWGVSTVVAAWSDGEDGQVVTYEVSEKYAARIGETAAINGLTDRTDVRHAVVGHLVDAYGDDTAAAPVIDLTELPACDVLELDCEGAELEILRNMDIRPRVVIVESHGNFGSPTGEVREALEQCGYEVVGREPAERGEWQSMVEDNDIYVLTAVRGR